MYTCIICRFPAEPDDAVAPTVQGKCVCVRCYEREIGDTRVMSDWLRQELERLLTQLPS